MSFTYTQFEVTQRQVGAQDCFLIGYDTSELIDITSISDAWGKYLNRHTARLSTAPSSQQSCGKA